MTDPLLRIDRLSVRFGDGDTARHAVRAVSFDVAAGEAVALVGESGSGKTQTALAVLGLSDSRARVEGSIRFQGDELLNRGERFLGRIRGSRIGMVFQDAMSSLAPHLRIGTQIAEPLIHHRGLAREAALAEALRLLDAVAIDDAPRRLLQYPHELSGGMRQRVQIAMALACRPPLLILDEPTTALDVTVQAQVLALLRALRQDFRLAMLLITHDLAVVAESCDRAVVLQQGAVVEDAPLERLLTQPAHAYTRQLLDARRMLA